MVAKNFQAALPSELMDPMSRHGRLWHGDRIILFHDPDDSAVDHRRDLGDASKGERSIRDGCVFYYESFDERSNLDRTG